MKPGRNFLIQAVLLALALTFSLSACVAPLSGAGEARAAASVGTGVAAVIHVSPDGDDRSSGRPDSPVRTLGRAQVLVRAHMATSSARHDTGAPLRVLLAPGTYTLQQTLDFTPADSGRRQRPVRWEAAVPGTATISGGVALQLRQPAAGGSPAVFDLPAAAGGTWRGGGQLIVNGQPATLARWPKAGRHAFVQQPLALAHEPTDARGHEAFRAAPVDLTWMTQLPADERARAVVQLMHSWTSSQHRIAALDREEGSVRLAPRARWAFLSTGASQRFFVENVPSALSEPGEWVAMPDRLLYLPRPGEESANLQVILPVMERLVTLRGDPASGQWVRHLSFHGLRFAHTRYLTPAEGFDDSQAAIGVGAAVEVDGAEHVRFEDCHFDQTAGYGLWLRRTVRDSQVLGCSFTQLGAGGIQVGVPRDPPGAVPSATARIELRNNRISHTGQIFPGGVGIWVGRSYDVTVAHNLVHDTSYTGISVGWSWSFASASTGRHRIENNLLVNIGSGRLSDMGGIYTLGLLEDTLIRGNLIRGVRAYPGYGPGRGLGGWGIYTDLGTASVRVLENVVVDTDSGGYHLNGGRDIIVRHNVFAGGRQEEIRLSRLNGQRPQALLQANLIVPSALQPIGGVNAGAELAWVDNLLSAGDAGPAMDRSRCAAGCAASAAEVVTGPMATELSFTGLDAAQRAIWERVLARVGPTAPDAAPGGSGGAATAGTSPTPAVLAGRELVVAQDLPPADLAPQRGLDLALGTQALGAPPALLRVQPRGDSQGVRIAAQPTAPGGRCLRLSDGPGYANRWDPHAYVELNLERGEAVSTFAILIDEYTRFMHELRDDERPYRAGPSLRISAEGVSVGGRVLAPMAIGRWTTVRVRTPLGTPGARWTLEVDDGNGRPRRFEGLHPASPRWQRLNWAGYVSDAAVPSSLCLAEVRITQDEEPR